MKKFITIALAATAAIAAASPAGAQFHDGRAQFRSDHLRMQLQAGVQSGAITRAEAMPLRRQLRQLFDLERRYAAGGFSGRERADLQNRMASLRQGIRMAGRDGNGRYDRDDDRWSDRRDCPPGLDRRNNGCLPPGQAGRDDGDGRWSDDRPGRGEWSDRSRDGHDDRDTDREDRIAADRSGEDRYDRGDEDYDDRDDRYDDRETRRDGIGGVFDSVLGGGGLRVGERVSADMGAVPSAYRSRYRDRDGVYYRSDGRQIYQIDAGTQTEVRIHPMTR